MIKAFGKNIIVKPVIQKDKPSLILTVKEEKPSVWEIVSMGSSVKNLSIGSKVFIPPYGSHTLKYEDTEYQILPYEMIWAVVE